jgi:hypothetical protein
MKALLGIALGAMMAMATAAPAFATPFDLQKNSGSYQALSVGDSGLFFDAASNPVHYFVNSGGGTDIYRFSLTGVLDLTSFAAKVGGGTLVLNTLKLFKIGNPTEIASVNTNSNTTIEKSFDYAGLTAGQYRVEVNLTGSGKYSGGVEVTPLPATLPFLAAGLAGLGIFRRRRQENAAA